MSKRRAPDDICARCGLDLYHARETGESGLYSPEIAFTLCVPCFDAEDAMVEETGHNDHPDVIAQYKLTVGIKAARHRRAQLYADRDIRTGIWRHYYYRRALRRMAGA